MGFLKKITLIEILIILSIVSILAAIVIPYFSGNSSTKYCSIYTPSNEYNRVEKYSIKETETTLEFKNFNEHVSVSKLSADVSCKTGY